MLLLLIFTFNAVLLQEGSPLEQLKVEGADLHPSLSTRQLGTKPIRHVKPELIQTIPQISSDPEFVQMIARGGSQGQLTGEGVVAALYALYDGENELGFYGLEAESKLDADRLESDARFIWRKNIAWDRAQVHRKGNVVVVVWTDGLPVEVWAQVNQEVSQRLATN